MSHLLRKRSFALQKNDDFEKHVRCAERASSFVTYFVFSTESGHLREVDSGEPDLQFVPQKKKAKGTYNVYLNGYRFSHNKTCADGEKVYWRCSLHKKCRCKAWITTVDNQLASPVPEHSHDRQAYDQVYNGYRI